MPYDNAYNRGIAHDIGAINERFATLYAYSPVDGRGGYSEGGSNAGVLFQVGNASKRDGEDNVYNDDLALPPVYYYGQDAEGLEGGNGFAAGTFRDSGEGSQLGARSATGHFDGAAAARSVAKYEGSGGFPLGDLGCGPSCKGCPQCCPAPKTATGSGYQGGNLFTDIYHGFEDLGSDIGSAVDYVIGSAKPKKQKLRALGRLLAHSMQHKLTGGVKAQAAAESLAGGSWWDSLKEGVSDVVSFLPNLAIHAIAGKKPDPLGGSAGPKGSKPRKMRGGDAAAAEISPPTGAGASGRQIGGAILGNPDGYPRMGDSARIAGRGRSKKVGGAKALEGPNGDLLAMPSPSLANGVPPRAQLRGSYGGAKPAELTKEAVIKAVKAKLKGKGAENPEKPESVDFEKGSIPKIGKRGASPQPLRGNLAGMTDNRAEAAPAAGGAKGADGRKRRAEIVKKVMQERGLKLIEASKYVKANNLYHA